MKPNPKRCVLHKCITRLPEGKKSIYFFLVHKKSLFTFKMTFVLLKFQFQMDPTLTQQITFAIFVCGAFVGFSCNCNSVYLTHNFESRTRNTVPIIELTSCYYTAGFSLLPSRHETRPLKRKKKNQGEYSLIIFTNGNMNLSFHNCRQTF